MNKTDISIIFDKKDNEFFEFKSVIKSKNDIRKLLGESDEKTILQFERWWDKYKDSLTDLEKENKEYENDMMNNLIKLGYEQKT